MFYPITAYSLYLVPPLGSLCRGPPQCAAYFLSSMQNTGVCLRREHRALSCVDAVSAETGHLDPYRKLLKSRALTKAGTSAGDKARLRVLSACVVPIRRATPSAVRSPGATLIHLTTPSPFAKGQPNDGLIASTNRQYTPTHHQYTPTHSDLTTLTAPTQRHTQIHQIFLYPQLKHPLPRLALLSPYTNHIADPCAFATLVATEIDLWVNYAGLLQHCEFPCGAPKECMYRHCRTRPE